MSFGLLIKLFVAFMILSYLWKKVGKFFVGVFAGNNSQENYNQNNNYSRQNNSNQKKAQVNTQQSQTKNFTAGDYVDFEEVD